MRDIYRVGTSVDWTRVHAWLGVDPVQKQFTSDRWGNKSTKNVEKYSISRLLNYLMNFAFSDSRRR